MGKKKRRPNPLGLDFNNLNFFYGIPHCHTILSTGRGTPYEALEYGKRQGLNFMIITDHNGYLYDNILDKETVITKWRFLIRSIEKFNKKNEDFVAIPGFETRSEPFGDLNILNPKTYFTGIVNNINSLLLWLIADGSAIVSINHPHKSIEKLPISPYLNEYLKTIEVGNGSPPHKYSRHDKYYYNLLDKGFKLGAINSEDNHRINFGESENLTGLIANNLDTISIIDAFKKHRTYATESRTLKLYFTINSVFMGESIDRNSFDELNFYVYAEDSKRIINTIQIISNGGKVIHEICDINLKKIKYMYQLKLNKFNSWYIIKVFLDDKKEALSSPIFIK
ncbi:hypothetical protein SAMN02745163_01139 [Clostridium cavendishii DSM 21758]|uniref:Polymerase/histidinol phosphatase N-terminal domain-containing protein n=1 Tax=Clostridium cavendishii DSM 21758 TaxID=1121302 RepID=A0A1M6FHK3_9CLOT|nr:CehA/McbA family metallohydrolase [Clostridium cavendishii]SHI97155.1 hypothetical protein SAMN02745163_01139 [Clostridium cavendishii DSM 21758]